MPDRFPPPWTIVDNGETFIVQDGNRFPIAYIYYREPPTMSVQRPSRRQAWSIARGIARLPDLLKRPAR